MDLRSVRLCVHEVEKNLRQELGILHEHSDQEQKRRICP